MEILLVIFGGLAIAGWGFLYLTKATCKHAAAIDRMRSMLEADKDLPGAFHRGYTIALREALRQLDD